MNRADGFSPGSMLMTKVPGLETRGRRQEQAAADHRPSKSLAARAPVVVINARTGKRHPIWSRRSTPTRRAPADRVLIIRPVRNFVEGERYIVALRNLKNASGATMRAGKNFRLYRDRPQDAAAARREPPRALQRALQEARKAE